MKMLLNVLIEFVFPLQYAGDSIEMMMKLFMTIVLGFIVWAIMSLATRRKKTFFIDMSSNENQNSASYNRDLEKVRKHNRNVAYNETAASWLGDIFMVVMFFPFLIYIIYRRTKYSKRI